MKTPWLAAIWLTVSATIYAGPTTLPSTQPDERWFTTRGVGDELIDERLPIIVDAAVAARLFTASPTRLAPNWEKALPAEASRLSPDAKKMPDDPKFRSVMRASRDDTPSAHVDQFSPRELVIQIDRPGGNYLWHHYRLNLATVRVPRSKELDALFSVPALEKAFAAEFHGFRQGDRAEDVQSKVGKPDQIETTQSMDYSRWIYSREGVMLHVESGRILSISRAEPEQK